MNEDLSHLSPQDIAKAQRIAYLVAGYIKRTLSTQEQDELDNWVAESDDNVLLFEEMIDEKNLAAMTEKIREIRTVEALDKTKQRISFRPVLHKTWFRQLFPYALAASILAAIITIFFLNRDQTSSLIPVAIKSHDIDPGGNKAILTLGNGKTIRLDSAQSGELAMQGNIKVIKTDVNRLSYSISIGGDQIEEYNELTTPRGGQFQLVLPDRTHIWMNSQSSIRYPTTFSGKLRTVELKGEAYFEVAKDARKPFHVRVGDADIHVLGTHFNVNAYDDEFEVKTTLLEGSLKINFQNDSVLLKPGEQGKWNKSEKIGTIRLIDIDEVVAWKAGMFSFHRDAIQSVMRQVARWYDVNINYSGSVKNHFNATIERNVPVSKLLKLLEETGGVHFEVKDKTIIVNP